MSGLFRLRDKAAAPIVHNITKRSAITQAGRSHISGGFPLLSLGPEVPRLRAGRAARLCDWLSFYEGRDIQAGFRRIKAIGWRNN
ncbi:MAG: hypothetical protein ACYSYV_05060 [Planctomycetota bacterium]